MCASYNPPNEYITQFNTRLFNQPEDTLSQAEANQLYLSKKTSDTSTAPLTTFQSQVVFNTDPPISNTTPSLPTHLATLAYLTSFYQPITGMTAYLTTAAAALIYQPISLMTNYLTTASAAIIYQPISLMTNYLTTASAASTYVSKINNVAENINGLKTFTNNIEIFDSSTTSDEPSLILRTISGASGSSIIKYSGSNLLISNTNTSGTTIFYVGGSATQLSISSTTTTINNALICSSQATFNTSCPISNTGATLAEHLTRRDFVLGQNFTTLALVQSNANIFTSQITFNTSCPISNTGATLAEHLTRRDFVLGQQFTTLALVQANANTFTAANQFNQPIKIQYAAAQYTDLDQTAQIFSIFNKSTGGSVRIQCRTSPGLVDTTVATFNTTGITLGINAGSNSINGSSTSFNHEVSITGKLTAGNTGLTNTISGPTTFNQNVILSGTASVTGLLTATGNLKTGQITAISTGGTQYIYTDLTAGGSISMGAASRTINFFGTGNFNNNCQFSGLLQTDDITALTGQGGSAQGIYTGLTTGGSITIGSNTANTTTNIRGGAISIGNSAYNLTIESPTTFNDVLKTNDITAILDTAPQSIYTSLASTGSITMGAITAGTITNIYGGAINIGNSANILTINSPTIFNNTLKTDDITAITDNATQNIYTTLTSSGIINLGATTSLTTTNIYGGAINIGGSANTLTINSPTIFNNTLKTDDITAISNTAIQNIYTGLASTGTINMGETTAGTITNIRGGQINIGHSTTDCNVLSNFVCNTNATFKAGFYLTDIGTGSPTDNALIVQQDNALRFDTNVNYANTYEFWIQSNLIFQIEQLTSYIYNTLNIIGSLKIRNDKLVDELQTLTTTSETLVFPLQQTTIFTNAGNISVTLPLINNDTQIGLRFTFLNLGSVSTITTFTAQGLNKIITIGQVAQVSSSTALINNANNSCSLVIVKLSGVYCWAEYI